MSVAVNAGDSYLKEYSATKGKIMTKLVDDIRAKLVALIKDSNESISVHNAAADKGVNDTRDAIIAVIKDVIESMKTELTQGVSKIQIILIPVSYFL